MSVETLLTGAYDVANGITTNFSLPFYFIDPAHIVVTLNDVVQSGGYTISGVRVPGGGTLVFAVAPSTGVVVGRKRVVPITQPIDTQNNQTIFEDVFDDGLDRRCMVEQQIGRKADLALKLPDTAASATVNTTLPALAGNASRTLAVNATENGFTFNDPFVLQAQAAAAIAVGAAALTGANVGIWQRPVKSILATPPGSPVVGDRYLVAAAGLTGAFVGHANQVAEWSASAAWGFGVPDDHQEIFVQSNYSIYRFKTSAWALSRTVVQPGDVLATAFASGASAFIITAGDYGEVTVAPPSNCTVTAVGKVIWRTTSTINPIISLVSKTNVVFRGGPWEFAGNGPTINPSVSPGTAVNNGQVAIYLSNSIGIDFEGFFEVHHISGYGIDEHAPASSFNVPGLNRFEGFRIHDCYFGAFVRDFAEYSNYSNCWFYQNLAAVRDESGNRGYYNCHFVFNYYGFFLDGTVEPGNNSHGIVSGCFINHNEVSIQVNNCQLGELFIGCQILAATGGSGGNSVGITGGSVLVKFVGCGLGAQFTVDATSQVTFTGCTIRSTLTTLTVAAGGLVTGSNNIDELGVEARLFNGMNSSTPTVTFGGAAVGITYGEQDGRFRYDSGYMDFTAEVVLATKGSSTGNILISGCFPANMGPVPNNMPITVIGAGLNAAVTDLRGFVAAGTRDIKLFNFNAGTITQLTNTGFADGCTLYLSGRVPLG